MKLRPEVLPPREHIDRRRFTRFAVAVGIAVGLGCAALDHLADSGERQAETARQIERLRHDVKWCGRRIDHLREQQRAIKFIAVAP